MNTHVKDIMNDYKLFCFFLLIIYIQFSTMLVVFCLVIVTSISPTCNVSGIYPVTSFANYFPSMSLVMRDLLHTCGADHARWAWSQVPT